MNRSNAAGADDKALAASMSVGIERVVNLAPSTALSLGYGSSAEVTVFGHMHVPDAA